MLSVSWEMDIVFEMEALAIAMVFPLFAPILKMIDMEAREVGILAGFLADLHQHRSPGACNVFSPMDFRLK